MLLVPSDLIYSRRIFADLLIICFLKERDMEEKRREEERWE
jgi:hypothetical protein